MPVKAGIALRPTTSPFAGARSRAMLLLHYKAKSFRLLSAAESLSLCVANGGVGRALPAGFPRIQNQERSIAFGDRVTFSLRGQRESNQRERPPRLALVGLPAQQVREPGPGFSTAHPCAGEKASASMPMPAPRPVVPTHRRTGAPGRAAGHPGPHFSEEPERNQSNARGLLCPSPDQMAQNQRLIGRLRPIAAGHRTVSPWHRNPFISRKSLRSRGSPIRLGWRLRERQQSTEADLSKCHQDRTQPFGARALLIKFGATNV